ncbi:hypothetical protein LOZ65_006000 [Ophidiomyces ophidiicola]|nr:hypothetical protein LOZ65_006000 [Ophidiomyces ophidiicola]
MGRRSSSATSIAGPSPRRRKAAAKTSSPARDGCTWAECACYSSRFLAATLSSLVLNTVLFSLGVSIIQGDIAWTSKHLDSWVQVVALLSWRVLEMGVAWVLDYDARDIASFIGLVNLPTHVLLYSFYGLRPTTILTVATINIISATIPFLYFRPTNTIHSVPSSSERAIVTDRQTAIYTTVVAAALYAVVLFLSFATWLPTHLVTYFEGLPSLEIAFDGAKSLVPMFIGLLPAGYATRDFLFVSSAGQPYAEEPGPAYQERSHELFAVLLYRKYWVTLPAKQRTLIARTIVLSSMSFANTVVHIVGTINGVELNGAMGWAAIWKVATVATGLVYGWIDAADGVEFEAKTTTRRQSTRTRS